MTDLFFDLDGTLTDPKEGITRCIRHALSELGMSPLPSADDLEWCIGPPLRGSFASLLDEARADAALQLYRQRFAARGLFENAVYPGIPPMLAGLQQHHRLFVASSKPLVYVRQILSHFELQQYFTGVFGSELDGTRADKSELLAFALGQTDCDPSRSIMIGDRKHDIAGARNNGMRSVGVLYGYGSRAELVAAGAGKLADTPGSLDRLLQASG